MALPKLFQRIFWHNNTTPAINEDNLNAMSKAIDDLDNRVIVLGDDVITVIPQIQAYLEQAEDLVEAMELLSENPPYIGQNGNWWVWDTNTSTFVDSGVDASISVSIADITMLAPNATPYVTNSGTDTDPIFHLFIPRGQTGNGISTIAKTGTSGLVDTYTITMTDGTTSTFTVTNGAGDMNKSVYDPTNAIANAGGMKSAAAKNSTNAVTENSTDLVESGAVYTADKGIYEVMGQNGAINLLPNNATSQTINGVTFTVNDDGSVTANGTATQVTQFPIINDFLILKTGNYILSTKNNIPTNVYFSIYITEQGWKDITNNANSIEFSKNSNIQISTCRLYIAKDVTLSDLTFYPMIADARYKGGYVPYAETNQQLTEKTNGLWDNMMDNGSVNLLDHDLKSGSDTYGGVALTISVNDKKEITISGNGTFSSNVSLELLSSAKARSLFGNGTYKLTGTPAGFSRAGMVANAQSYGQVDAWDTGNGSIFTNSTGNIILRFNNGYTISGSLVFKPMISDPSLNLSYDDYVPYAKTNRELTEEIVTTGTTALTNSGTDYELLEGFIYKKKGVNILSVAVKCVTPSPMSGGNHIKFSELPSGFSKPPAIIYSTIPCYRDGTTNEGAQLQIATNGDLRIRGGEAGARYSGLFAF